MKKLARTEPMVGARALISFDENRLSEAKAGDDTQGPSGTSSDEGLA